eukprot:6239895-Alexandrium_andersonii.AAC.1
MAWYASSRVPGLRVLRAPGPSGSASFTTSTASRRAYGPRTPGRLLAAPIARARGLRRAERRLR